MSAGPGRALSPDLGRQGGGLGWRPIAGLLGAALALLQLPELPTAAWFWAALLLGLLLLWRVAAAWPALLLLGIGWTGVAAWQALDQRWQDQAHSVTLDMTVRVSGLPARDALASRFAAVVLDAPAGHAFLIGRRLQVSWFADPPPLLLPGEHWRLSLRLRAPRGLRNPGGFDYERHALVQRIAALATVAGAGERLAPATGADLLRARIADRIQASGAAASTLLRGLAVGDTRELADADWDRLRLTGLSHLLAISGLHIGIVAGFAALWLRGLYWLVPTLALRLPLPQAAALAALLGAAGYAVLAGLSLPTLRSLLMLVVALAAVLLRREGGLGQPLALSALALWLLDPLSLLTPGYWLSLAGVFWLLACVPRGQGWRGMLGGLVRAQLVLGLALLPLSVLFFGGSSLIGLPLNLLAVPWVTLVVVPLLLFGVALLPWPMLAAPCLQLAGQAMQVLWWLAGKAAALPAAYLHLPEPGPVALLLALSGLLLMLAPRGVPGRALASLLLLPLLWPARAPLAEGEYRVDLLDVGQGLAVLVRTRHHALLFDTAARSRSGFDLGDAAVVPALRALGVSRLDRILVSHGDIDHAGGLGAVRTAFPEARVWAGEPKRLGFDPCQAGSSWRWNEVSFRVLHPPAHFPELGNESSCVLRVAGAGGRSLLPGDISEVVEARLLREHRHGLAAELLVVPHHGSRSSSSAAWVRAVAPRWAAIAAGPGNRFGHPHPEVLERYLSAGSELVETARGGRAGWLFTASGARLEILERRDRRRFWDATAR